MRARGAERISDDERVVITFEGRPIDARRGETIAAALAAAGELELRETQSGARRGVFCGMGVCQDCRVVVDGRHGQRACMTRIAGPVEVNSHPPRAPVAADDVRHVGPQRSLPTLRPELLVIGGGAAGLAAATAAAGAGIEVVLADERSAAGGQYYKQLARSPDLPLERFADRQMQRGRDRIRSASEAGVTMLASAEVIAAFPTMSVLVKSVDGMRVVAPRRLIVATGGYERALTLPGWTLPGVMTTGALQTLLRNYRVLPGRRIVIAGNGPLNLQVAVEASRAGADVLAVAEHATIKGSQALSALAGMLGSSPALTVKGVALRTELTLRRVPLLVGTRLRSIRRSDGGLVVELDRGASAPPAHFDTDIVTMSYGILPSNDVLRLLGCEFDVDPRWDTLVPVRDGDGMTSLDGIYAVGDCARFAGAHVAEIEGTLAGLAAARSLGYAADRRLEARLRRRLARHRRFQQRLWQLYDALVPASDAVPPETVICRCEERTQADMAQAIADGAAVIGNLKRITRSGMGPCQGRYCGAPARALLRGNARTSPGEDSSWAARPPIKPTAIAELIAGLSRYDA